jgi:hypothetical protein
MLFSLSLCRLKGKQQSIKAFLSPKKDEHVGERTKERKKERERRNN